MTYMQSNLAFASGIQELSVDEIGFVSGGFGDDIGYGFFTPQGLDDWGAGKKKKKENDSPPPPGGRVIVTIYPNKTRKLDFRCEDGQPIIVTKNGDKTKYTCPAPR